MWALLTRGYGSTPYARASYELGAEPEFLETWIPERSHPNRPAPAEPDDPQSGAQIVDFRSPRGIR